MANLLTVLEVAKRIGDLDEPDYSRPVPANSVLSQ